MGYLLKEIERIKGNLLPSYGWMPSEPSSPRWWGGFETEEEIAIAAVLVQLTTWNNVDRTVASLRREGLTELSRLMEYDIDRLAEKIRGVGFAVEKARRIVKLAEISKGDLDGLCSSQDARERLLGVRGIGRETADTILLFACNRLVFPASRLGVRVLSRVGVEVHGGYEVWRRTIEEGLPPSLYDYKLMHAGLVTIAKVYCKRSKPRCRDCPLSRLCAYARRASRSRA